MAAHTPFLADLLRKVWLSWVWFRSGENCAFVTALSLRGREPLFLSRLLPYDSAGSEALRPAPTAPDMSSLWAKPGPWELLAGPASAAITTTFSTRMALGEGAGKTTLVRRAI